MNDVILKIVNRTEGNRNIYLRTLGQQISKSSKKGKI